MKKVIGLTVCVVFAVVIIFSPSCGNQSNEKAIKIGAILPLTGDGAKYGEEAQDAFELAKDKINSKGGIKGQKIVIIYEDDQGKPQNAVNAFNKLISLKNIPIIMGLMYSSTANVVAPLGEKNKVVLFSSSASAPELTSAGDYFFRNWPSDIYEGGEMAKFCYRNLGLRKIAILSVNLDYGVGLTKVFKKTIESLGGEIISVDNYEQGANDFRAILSKLKKIGFDAIYLPGYYTEIGLILKQSKELGLKGKFVSCVGFDNPKILEIAGDACEGVYFARPFFDVKREDTETKRFVTDFKQRYGSLPGTYSAHAYDALNIIAEAIKTGGFSSDGIREALYKIKDFPGVTGATSFDKNGDVIKPILIMKVENGEFIETNN